MSTESWLDWLAVVIRGGAFLALGFYGLVGIVANWIIAISYVIHRKGASTVPLPGLAACVALLVSPIESVRRWWWLPLVLEAVFVGIGLLDAVLVRRARKKP